MVASYYLCLTLSCKHQIKTAPECLRKKRSLLIRLRTISKGISCLAKESALKKPMFPFQLTPQEKMLNVTL